MSAKMFSLANGKLVRLNADGTEGDIVQTEKSSLTVGASAQSDYCVDESELAGQLAFKIYLSVFGNVSTIELHVQEISTNGQAIGEKNHFLSFLAMTADDAIL